MLSSPGSARTSTANPESRNTWIIWWLPGSTAAVNVRMPSLWASSARCASSTVAIPRPCQLVGDLEGDLGTLGRLAHVGGVGDDPLLVAGDDHEPAAAVADEQPRSGGRGPDRR